MTSVFDVLPGVEIPVGEIAKSLAQMWSPPPAPSAPPPSAAPEVPFSEACRF